MKRGIVGVMMVVAVVLFVNFDVNAKARSAQAQGKRLVQQVWKDIKAKRWDKIEKMMAPGFQSVHDDGARDRAAELTLIKNLNIGKYKMSKIRATKNGPALVVTYMIAVRETIDGKRLSRAPAPRMSVFVKDNDGWLWAAHANLNPIR